MTNADLAARILHYCSRKSPVTVEELNEALPHVGLAQVTEMAYELVEARLLRGSGSRNNLIEGDVLFVDPIHGLTFLGEQYLHSLDQPMDGTIQLH